MRSPIRSAKGGQSAAVARFGRAHLFVLTRRQEKHKNVVAMVLNEIPFSCDRG